MKTTGILQKLDLIFPEFEAQWEFFEDAANVNEKGTSKTIEEDNSVTLDYPAFESGYALFSILGILVFTVFLGRKRNV